jgi:hypothetical protein
MVGVSLTSSVKVPLTGAGADAVPFGCLSTSATVVTDAAPAGRASAYPECTVALLVGAHTTNAPPELLVSLNRAIRTSACPEVCSPA